MSRVSAVRSCVALAAAALVAFPVLGKEDEGDVSLISVEGTVSDVSGKILKLLNGKVTVDASSPTISIVSGQNDSAASNNPDVALSKITVGTIIKASGTKGEKAGELLASHIEVHGQKLDGTLQGPIEAVAPGKITLLGLDISLTTSTAFETNNGVKFDSAADLKKDMVVEVEVAVAGTSLVATRISLSQVNFDQPGPNN